MVTASDQVLLSRAKVALQSSSYYALRHLDVKETTGGLVISGQVPSYYQKQQAQEIVRLVISDAILINRIEVV